MKVLFAVNDEKDAEAITRVYQKEYKEIISSKTVYYFNAIIKELQKDKTYDRVVISEDLEMFASDNYQAVDKFVFEKMDAISDEATNAEGNDIPIILLCMDRRTKNDPLLSKLFGLGLYNVLVGQDRSVQKVAALMYKPRTKKEAKAYYKVETENVSYTAENNSSEVSESEIQNILNHYKKIGNNVPKCVQSFDSIASQYSKEQVKLIAKVLPNNVKVILGENSDSYRKIMGIRGKKVAGTSELRKNEYVEKEIDTGSKLSQPVIIPTAVSSKKVNKVQSQEELKRKKQEERIAKEKASAEAKKKEEERIAKEKAAADAKKKEEERIAKEKAAAEAKKKEEEKIAKAKAKAEEEIQVVKRGRGRPRKNPIEEVVLEDVPVKKRRGRPRKNEKVDEELELKYDELEDEVLDEKDSIQDGILEAAEPQEEYNLQNDEVFDLEEFDDENEDFEDFNEFDEFDDYEDSEDSEDLEDLEDLEVTENDNLDVENEYEDIDNADDFEDFEDFEDFGEFEDVDENEEDFQDEVKEEEQEDDEDSDFNFDDILDDDDNDDYDYDFVDDEEQAEEPIEEENSTDEQEEDDDDDDFDFDDFDFLDEDETESDKEEEPLSEVDDEEVEEDDTLPGFDDEEVEEDDTLPGFDDEEVEEDDTLPGFDDEEEVQHNGSFKEINNKNYKYDNDLANSIKDLKETEEATSYNAETDNLIVSGQKIVAFVGTSKNGTSFIVNNLAELYSNKGIKTAILDLTKNKNAYYIYTNNEEYLREKAHDSLEKLKDGTADGVVVNKNLTVFTSLPGQDYALDDVTSIIKTLLENYSMILLDCDFETDVRYFRAAQEIYLVQSLDVLTIQPLTAFLRDLKVKDMLETNKLRIIINKNIKVNPLNEKVLIGGMSVYNDPGMTYMTELFNKETIKYTTIPFESQVYVKYLEGLVNCQISSKGYSKNFMNSLNKLADMVYPTINGKKAKNYNDYSNKQFEDAFSKNTSSILNKMKKKY